MNAIAMNSTRAPAATVRTPARCLFPVRASGGERAWLAGISNATAPAATTGRRSSCPPSAESLITPITASYSNLRISFDHHRRLRISLLTAVGRRPATPPFEPPVSTLPSNSEIRPSLRTTTRTGICLLLPRLGDRRQLHDARIHERRRDHQDNDQHQHHVDIRHDVDVRHQAAAFTRAARNQCHQVECLCRCRMFRNSSMKLSKRFASRSMSFAKRL